MAPTTGRRRWSLLAAALAVVVAACSGTGDATEDPVAGTIPAAEFPAGLDWLNTGGRTLAMSELRGKVVALHFWSASCINCLHAIPDLERLAAEFADELIVIGVHAPRFPTEAATDTVRHAVLSTAIEHPVVNDTDLTVSEQWGVDAQPTVALVDPTGNVVGARSGEDVYEALQPIVASLIEQFDGSLDTVERLFPLEREGLPATVLSFPAGIAVDAAQTFAYTADTANHRIVVVALPDGDVVDVYGSGDAGFTDGTTEAAFSSPRGLALSGDQSTLYVADTGNHAVRAVDTASGAVSTVAGTGSLGPWPPAGGAADEVALRSPWDVAVVADVLVVAMAGSHQLWTIDLQTGDAEPVAGSGEQAIADGTGAEAALSRPSGLAVGGDSVYFTDPESSTVRRLGVNTFEVGTVAGPTSGLFVSGDGDGAGAGARFQHPLGIAWDDGRLIVADTYNHRVRAVTAATGETVTLFGSTAGWRDGPDPLLASPQAVEVVGSTLYVADTNNHVLRIVDLDTGDASTLVLRGIEAFQPTADEEDYRGTVIELESVDVAAGDGTIVIDITLPPDHKINDDAPSSIAWIVDGGIAALPDDLDPSLTGATFPVSYPVAFSAGSGAVTADLNLFWCANDAESLCFIEQVRLRGPVSVGESGSAAVRLTHEIVLPEIP